MSECPRCYTYKTLKGQTKIQYCSLHSLAPWMAQWLGEIIADEMTPRYIEDLKKSTVSQLQYVGALDENLEITDWVKEIKW